MFFVILSISIFLVWTISSAWCPSKVSSLFKIQVKFDVSRASTLSCSLLFHPWQLQLKSSRTPVTYWAQRSQSFLSLLYFTLNQACSTPGISDGNFNVRAWTLPNSALSARTWGWRLTPRLKYTLDTLLSFICVLLKGLGGPSCHGLELRASQVIRKVLIKKEVLGFYFLPGGSFTPVHISHPSPRLPDLHIKERWEEYLCCVTKSPTVATPLPNSSECPLAFTHLRRTTQITFPCKRKAAKWHFSYTLYSDSL